MAAHQEWRGVDLKVRRKKKPILPGEGWGFELHWPEIYRPLLSALALLVSAWPLTRFVISFASFRWS